MRKEAIGMRRQLMIFVSFCVAKPMPYMVGHRLVFYFGAFSGDAKGHFALVPFRQHSDTLKDQSGITQERLLELELMRSLDFTSSVERCI